jgi:AcrR family transcriptional regulator
MTAAAARHGYGGASVSRVIKRVGVSRATFYEYFDSRDDCFLAAYCQVASQIEAAVERIEAGRPAAYLPRRVLADVLSAADADPEGARLMSLEALAGPVSVREEHERLLDRLEGSVERYLSDDSPELAQLGLTARAALGGVAGVAGIRLCHGDAKPLLGLLDDLVAWVGSYALPAGSARIGPEEWESLGAAVVRMSGARAERGEPLPPLPRGRAALPPGDVAVKRRRRILEAVAKLARTRGYSAMTVASIVAEAGLNREAFYAHFRNKQDAFLATQLLGLEESAAATASAFFAGETWADRAWNGLEALLAYAGGQPDLVFVNLIETYAGGTAAIRRAFDNRMAFTLFLEDGYRQRPQAAVLPRLCSEAIGGAVFELMRRQVTVGRSPQMLELLPEAAFVAVAPFIGPERAIDLVRERSRRPPVPARASWDRG